MHPSVAAAFGPLNAQWEARTGVMYLDMHRDPATGALDPLVTTGVGCLIDPKRAALPLPWRHRGTGKLADRAAIEREWTAIKARPGLAPRGLKAFERIATLTLDDAAIDALVEAKLQAVAAALRRQFRAFDLWPADAQMALLNMAWARGAHGFARDWPKLTRALLALDFATAAAECTLKEAGNPGVRPRNAANRILFKNAAIVVRESRARATLVYPAVLK